MFEFCDCNLSNDDQQETDILYIREYVFVCLMKRESSNDSIPYYVSKVYNLLNSLRFIVLPKSESFEPFTHIMLAEEPAKVFGNIDFNVELHYLELRKYHSPSTI